MMRIKKNPNWTAEQHKQFTQQVKDNQGYCPCSLLKKEDTKCICKAFLEQKKEGECHCGRYVKTNS